MLKHTFDAYALITIKKSYDTWTLDGYTDEKNVGDYTTTINNSSETKIPINNRSYAFR